MKLAYIRVSSQDQNEARQMEAMRDKGIEKFFIEKASGKDMQRPKLIELLDFAREGDIIYIHDFSRIARSTRDLLDIVERLNTKGVHIVSNKENLDTNTPTGRLMLTMIGAINTFERECLLERQKEGIAIARSQGKYKGRQPKKIDAALFERLMSAYKAREITKVKFAKELGVSRPTLDRMLKKMVEAHNSGSENSHELVGIQ